MSDYSISEPIVNEDAIVRHTVNSLTSMLQEDREAKAKQIVRDGKIKAARLIIELYSGKTYEDILFDYSGELPKEAEYLHPDETKEGKEAGSTDELEFNYPKGTWKDKIVAILKFESRVLSIKELVQIIEIYQKDLNHDSITNVISNTITTKLSKDGTLRIYKPDYKIKGFYYGSPLWWDGDILKEQYKPKPKTPEVWK